MRDLKVEELKLVAGGNSSCDSTGGKGNNGYGNGGHDGVPGHSDKSDKHR